MYKKIIILITICGGLLTGCSGQGRVNEKAYLRAASVDGEQLTFAFYSDDDETVTVTADSPEEAKSKAEIAVGKEIFTGHTELILLNDCNNAEVLEFMLHKWKVSPGCMVVRDENNGTRLLRTKDVPSITGAIKSAQRQGKAGKCDIITVLSEELK